MPPHGKLSVMVLAINIFRMKIFNFLLSLFTALPFALFSQSLTIENGASVIVKGDGGTGTDGTLIIEGDLTIENDGKLAAEDDARFFLTGDIHYEEGLSFQRGASIFTLNGTSAQQITNANTTGNFTFFSLVLDNASGFTINTTGNADVDIYDILDVQSGQITTNDNLIIEVASPSSYGRVAASPVSNPIVGNVTVKKRLTNTNAAWRQMNMPIDGRWEDGNWDGITFNYSIHNPSSQINVFRWNAAGASIAQGWEAAAGTTLGSTPVTVFLDGGNSVFDVSQTFSCEGELRDNVASFGYTLQFTRDPDDLSGTNPAAVGWNNIPNPWAALIDVQAWLTSVDFKAFEPAYKAVHVYNSVTGQYQAILLNNTVTKVNWNTDGTDIDDADANIPPFQAVWVKADAANQSVTLYPDEMQTTNQKNTANEQFMKQKPEVLRLNVFDQDSLWDQIVYYTKQGSTREFDNIGDAYFLKSPNKDAPSFYAMEGEMPASLVSRSFNITDSIEIAYASKKNLGDFSIMVDRSAFDAFWNVYLKDKVTGLFIEIDNKKSYVFQHKEANMTNRFVVYFSKNESVFGDLVSVDESNVSSFFRNNALVVKSFGASGRAEIDVFDLAGRQLLNTTQMLDVDAEIELPLNIRESMVLVQVNINGKYFVDRVYVN